MAPTHTAPRLTPLAALLDMSLRNTKGHGLATTLAIMRMPSGTWASYDTIAALLETHSGGRTLNRVTIKSFAEELFRIPNTRYVTAPDGKIHGMPKVVEPAAVDAYLTALADAPGVDVDAVRAVADQEQDDRETAEVSALADQARGEALADVE